MAQLSPKSAGIPIPASLRPRAGVVVLWWLMTLLCAAVVAGASHYFLRRPTDHFGEHFPLLLTHIVAGTIALLIGPWQFSRRLRRRNIALHRVLGRIYLCSVGVGSVAGFTLSFFSQEGLPTHLGFGFLAVCWFCTGLMAYRRVLAGDINAHRRWVIRNFALSLAAVTLRIYLPLLLIAGHWSFASAYIAVSWLCWIPNVFVAEWMVRRPVVAAA